MSDKPVKPNIIFICSDHHRADALGCAGNRICRTPSLDRLAGKGVIFEQCYTQNPVCSPARASIMTGCLSRRTGLLRNGMSLRREVPTMADILKGHGYHTAAVGKLHLTPAQEGVPEAPFYGFEHVECVEDNSLGAYMDWALKNFPQYEGYLIGTMFNLPTNEEYWKGRRDFRREYLEARAKHVLPLEISKTCNWGYCHYSPLPEEAHKNTWITSRAISCLESRDAEQPLLLWVGYVDPHVPYDPPERFRNMYLNKSLPPRIHRPGEEEMFPPHTRALSEYFRSFTEEDWRIQRALFYGSVTFMDEQIGRLIDSIEQKLDMENTIIVYLTDHGDFVGDHGLSGKQAYHYDGGIRIPLICRRDGHWPAGISSSEIVEQIDILPSILNAAGIDAPVMDGRSFAAVLRGEPHENPRQHAYVESYNGAPEDPTPPPLTWARTVRSRNWRATFYPEVDYGELFDMRNDPEEVCNLWFNPEYREVIEQHRKILLDRLIMMDYPLPELKYQV